MSEYVDVVCIIDWCSYKNRKRVRPADNSIFPSTQWVECAKEISQTYKVGTTVLLKVKEKANANSDKNSDHLYSSYKWSYKILKIAK